MESILKRLAELEARVDDLESQKRGKRFVPPTVDEVRGHCIKKGYTFDPETFVNHYKANGWKVGRNKMKLWESACVTWQKREAKNGADKQTYQQRIEESDRQAFTLTGDL